MADELDEAIETQLLTGVAGPKRVRGDEGEVEARSLTELIELDKYRRSRTARNRARVRTTKLIPPGTD
jgi:hypothetical protein